MARGPYLVREAAGSRTAECGGSELRQRDG